MRVPAPNEMVAARLSMVDSVRALASPPAASGRSHAHEKHLRSTLTRAARVFALTAGNADRRVELMEMARGQVDWADVARLAARERAAAQVYRCLVAAIGEDAADITQLRHLAKVSEFQLAFLNQRLRRTLEEFARAGIEVVLLKGAGLALSAYSDISDRPMGDVYLLVHADRAVDAWQLAVSAGWVARRDIEADRVYDEHHHLSPLEDPFGIGVGLEVHTELFSAQAPFSLNAEAVWKEALRIQAGTVTVWVPDVHHQLLHACLHFAWSHEASFGAWRTIRDVMTILDSGTVDWDRFVALAHRSRGASCCYWTLRLVGELGGALIPDRVLQQLAPPLPRWLSSVLLRHLASQAFPPRRPCPSVFLARMLWQLAIQPDSQQHGPARPWYDTDKHVRLGSSKASRSTLADLARPLERMAKLVGYVALLIGPLFMDT